MCCIWSTYDPPDIVEGTQPFQDIEKAFGITIDDDDAFEMYDMTLNEALVRIQQIKKRQNFIFRFQKGHCTNGYML